IRSLTYACFARWRQVTRGGKSQTPTALPRLLFLGDPPEMGPIGKGFLGNDDSMCVDGIMQGPFPAPDFGVSLVHGVPLLDGAAAGRWPIAGGRAPRPAHHRYAGALVSGRDRTGTVRARVR